MSSIAAGVNAERTNRWLLIGALVLAVLAGVLVFALLANFGGDDDESVAGGSGGDVEVLVANQSIEPGTTVSEDMFDVISVKDSIVVPDHVDDAEVIVGETARVEILQGNQISLRQFAGGVNDDFDEQLTFKVPEGMRAYAMSISESTAVGGLLVPGDRVDIVVQYSTKVSQDAQFKQIHYELFAENVEVLARAQTDVEEVPVIDASSAAEDDGEDTEPVDDGVSRRPTDISPDPGAATVTLALTPAQVLALGSYDDRLDGEISIALRRFGDDAPFGAQPFVIDVFEN
jgi:Flp pilus assembly protein CpaB